MFGHCTRPTAILTGHHCIGWQTMSWFAWLFGHCALVLTCTFIEDNHNGDWPKWNPWLYTKRWFYSSGSSVENVQERCKQSWNNGDFGYGNPNPVSISKSRAKNWTLPTSTYYACARPSLRIRITSTLTTCPHCAFWVEILGIQNHYYSTWRFLVFASSQGSISSWSMTNVTLVLSGNLLLWCTSNLLWVSYFVTLDFW